MKLCRETGTVEAADTCVMLETTSLTGIAACTVRPHESSDEMRRSFAELFTAPFGGMRVAVLEVRARNLGPHIVDLLAFELLQQRSIGLRI